MVSTVCVVITILCVSICAIVSGHRGRPSQHGGRNNRMTQIANPRCPLQHIFIEGVEQRCVEICPLGCGGGRCRKDQTCVCNKGYALGKRGKHCFPQCPQGCPNGSCSSPGICTCSADYRMTQSGQCIPRCPGGCPNAKCIAPNVCECRKGFHRDATGQCVNMCPLGCTNGECTAPNVCTCKPGFERGLMGRCHRPCPNKGCPTATIINCQKGFTQQGDVCIPVCSRCAHGQCTAPNVCTCKPGYSYDREDQSCFPICDQRCVNGICVGPNECECAYGYKLDINNPFQCNPNCNKECVNGYCIGNNVCECSPGFKQVDGKRDCVRDGADSIWDEFVLGGQEHDFDVRIKT